MTERPMNDRLPNDRLLNDHPVSGRFCSKVGCTTEAVSTLTFDYADSMAALGPLSPSAGLHSHDLCARHAEHLSVPQGWQIVRHSVLGGKF